jgi:thiol-disulfide isomerase/thioredoxin
MPAVRLVVPGLVITLLSLTLAACENAPPRPKADPSAASASAASPRASASAQVQSIGAGDGEVAALVKAEAAKARAEGLATVVYVGATWCEPCRYFHEALAKGALEGKLPKVRFVEFDLDRDEARLKAAGYGTEYVPLFVVPEDDGRGGTRRIAGSIKGPGAVDEITPRLKALLGG